MLVPPIPYQLRKMILDDLTAVKEIDRLSFPTPARDGMFEHEIDGNNLAYYQVLEQVTDSQNTSIIGYSGYWLIGDELHVSTIATHPTWRGKKLGELLLLNMLMDCYKQPTSIATLEVRINNKTAQNLYLKYKFDIVGQRKRYYRDTGEDALIMTVQFLDAAYLQFLKEKQNILFTHLTSEAETI